MYVITSLLLALCALGYAYFKLWLNAQTIRKECEILLLAVGECADLVDQANNVVLKMSLINIDAALNQQEASHAPLH